MTTTIEWLVEEVDDVDDIIDVHHYDTAAEVMQHLTRPLPEGIVRYDYGLVRDAADGSRSWAYIKDGKWPTHFEDAMHRETAKVPTKYLI